MSKLTKVVLVVAVLLGALAIVNSSEAEAGGFHGKYFHHGHCYVVYPKCGGKYVWYPTYFNYYPKCRFHFHKKKVFYRGCYRW